MSNNSSSSSSSGVGVVGLLGVAFVVLKLTGVIDWSWWWVTAPFWGGWALVLGIVALGAGVVGVVAAGSSIFGSLERKKRRKRLEARRRGESAGFKRNWE